MWTEEPILDDDSRVLLDVEAVQAEVDDYTQKAYKAAKANKDVSLAFGSRLSGSYCCKQHTQAFRAAAASSRQAAVRKALPQGRKCYAHVGTAGPCCGTAEGGCG